MQQTQNIQQSIKHQIISSHQQERKNIPLPSKGISTPFLAIMAASSSSASPATAVFSFEHFLSSSPSEQLCCVRCNLCATVLVVSVPCSSLLMTVRVRCGQCTNLFAVNMKGLLLSQANQFQASQRSLLLDEIPRPPSSLLMDLTTTANNNKKNTNSSNNNNTVNADSGSVVKLPFNGGMEDVNQLGRMPAVSRPPEKRQRIPSAYNRFIKDEIQRIKAGNPDITHREAFSAAAKNWAHFPHIHFGLMPDQVVRTTGLQQQEEDSLLLKEFYKGTATDMGGSVTCNF